MADAFAWTAQNPASDPLLALADLSHRTGQSPTSCSRRDVKISDERAFGFQGVRMLGVGLCKCSDGEAGVPIESAARSERSAIPNGRWLENLPSCLVETSHLPVVHVVGFVRVLFDIRENDLRKHVLNRG